MVAGPDHAARILASLDALIALLRAHDEERWAGAFDRVREHALVASGAPDPRSAPRVVRDLLHMYAAGLPRFAALALRRDGATAPGATAELHAHHAALHTLVAEALGREVPPAPEGGADGLG